MNAFADALRAEVWQAARGEAKNLARERGQAWDDNFAAQQIESLVQQIFLAPREHPVRQVGFCGVETRESASLLCREVAQVLALRAAADICLVETTASGQPYGGTDNEVDAAHEGSSSLRRSSRQIAQRVWQLSPGALDSGNNAIVNVQRELLLRLRREFDFTIVELPAQPSAAALLGSVLDGTVLVLSAHSTRRVVAQQAKARLIAASVPLLGAVLSERTFPIPDSIYRRV